jgi:recombination protein RecT
MRVALALHSRQPELADCTGESFLLFCMRCAETGLEPIGAGGAWAVPFNNGKTGRREIQFIPDWRGLIHLAKTTGQIAHGYSYVVREGDAFTVRLGDNPGVDHTPKLEGKGETIGAYFVAVLPDGTKHIEYMRRSDLDAIEKRSKASSGPWKTDPDEMRRKTVVKRGLKPFAASPELATALRLDNEATGLALPDKSPVQLPEAIVGTAASKPAENAEPTTPPASDPGKDDELPWFDKPEKETK